MPHYVLHCSICHSTQPKTTATTTTTTTKKVEMYAVNILGEGTRIAFILTDVKFNTHKKTAKQKEKRKFIVITTPKHHMTATENRQAFCQQLLQSILITLDFLWLKSHNQTAPNEGVRLLSSVYIFSRKLEMP